MTKDELKQLLNLRTNGEFVDSEILGRRPWIFADEQQYTSWSASVANVLTVQTDHVRIVGSAATGYSLGPLKAGRPFRTLGLGVSASDIDIAITSNELFVDAWNTIVALDRHMGLRMSTDDRERMRLDIYWGLVAQKSLPTNTNAARAMLTAVSVATRMPPIRGHTVRCRIYRRMDDLRAYHISSLRQLRAALNA
jgi:hypothetical protein